MDAPLHMDITFEPTMQFKNSIDLYCFAVGDILSKKSVSKSRRIITKLMNESMNPNVVCRADPGKALGST